jgi:hypothetical protein
VEIRTKRLRLVPIAAGHAPEVFANFTAALKLRLYFEGRFSSRICSRLWSKNGGVVLKVPEGRRALPFTQQGPKTALAGC